MIKRYLSLPIALLLLLTIISIPSAVLVKADNVSIDTTLMTILSPQPTVYHNSSIAVRVLVHKPIDQKYPLITQIRYTLNESNAFSYKDANFTYNGIVNLTNNKIAHQYTGNAILEDLKEGNYTLSIQYGTGNSTIGSFSGSSVKFRVLYGSYEPAELLSPTNQTYHSSDIPLTLSINEPYVYAYYCLNGGKPIFINNTSSIISGVPVGCNSLVVFIKYSDIQSVFPVILSVDSTQNNGFQTLSYELIIVVAVVLAIILAVIALVIRKKVKTNK
jgi:hypothetical protein